MSNTELFVLLSALRHMSLALDELISGCIDENDNIVAPSRRDIMRARGCLPKYCKMSLEGK